MKQKFLAVLTVVGVLGVSSAAFADFNVNVDIDNTEYRPIAKTQNQSQRPPEPRNLPNGERPPAPPTMSRDIKGQPPMPPKGDKNGKQPPMSGDRRPPRPRSDDRRPPEMPKDRN